MYEGLIKKYEIIFEGIPEPIFYGRYYPMGHKEGPHGNELWDLFNYGRGLKKDKDPSAELYDRFKGDYEADLRALLNCVMQDTKGVRRGVVVIPSSKRGSTNRATELVRRILASNPGPFADLTSNFVRVRQKHAAHEGGDRSIASNIATLEVRPSGLLDQFGAILVIDDIVTSGNSFRAANEVLRRAGFAGVIINYAFSRTFPSDGAVLCMEASQDDTHMIYAIGDYLDEYWGNHPLDGLILDLDQTLIEDPVRNTTYEEVLWKDTGRQSAAKPYALFDGVSDIFELGLPTAILSNRPIAEIEHIIEDSFTQCDAYYDNIRCAGSPIKPFSFPTENSGTYTIRYYKPSSRGVEEANRYLQPLCVPATYTDEARIVGVGNTKEDMFAYNNANIESLLALWGVPDYLKEYARNHWGAALVFETPQELAGCLGRSAGYCDKATFYESEPRGMKRATAYYKLAIKYDDNVKKAAFELAYAVAEDDPEEAIELYERAIAAGDEYASTNNLALLIADRDHEKAVSLYERSIAAGNTKTAARNLALLIMRETPDRAVELLRQAAQEGNAKSLTEDLKPLLIAGNERAVELYQEYAEGSSGEKAKRLAMLLADSPVETGIPLLKAAIAGGDEAYATRELAIRIMGDDPDQAITLLERAIAAGNECDLLVDLKPLLSSLNKRAIQLVDDQIISKEPKRAFDLAVLVAGCDRTFAKELYERAIAAGDEYASTGNLANLIAAEDPTRARDLYERAIAAGEMRYATNNLAILIAREEPERAKELYEQAMSAGDKYYAPRNLALLVIADDPNRAVDLLEIAANNGNKGSLAVDLEPAIKAGSIKAVKLYERVIVKDDEKKANDLANLIKAIMPERVEELYRRAIAAGDERYATFNLAAWLAGSKPDEAEALYERAIKAGDTEWAPNNLGTLILTKDLSKARALFQQAIEAGEDVFATCNLAHTYLPSDASRAIELYERSLKSGDETEAKLGLSYLLKDDQQERAADLAAQALAAPNMKPSFDFLIEVLMVCNKETAFEVTQYFIERGYLDASETLIKLGFGDNYDPDEGLVYFGTDFESGSRIPWLMLGPANDGILLLSKFVISKQPFVDDAPEATWESSEVRRWLNGAFAELCFSSDEIESIIVRPDLGDRFFCLSGSELYERFDGKSGDISKAAIDNRSKTASKWWLRPESGGTLSAPCIDEAGKQAWSFALIELGVRPAVILRLR